MKISKDVERFINGAHGEKYNHGGNVRKKHNEPVDMGIHVRVDDMDKDRGYKKGERIHEMKGIKHCRI